MAVIGDRRTWALNTQEARMRKGKLLRVTHPDGRITKMYEADAIAAGLLSGKKVGPPPANKMAPLPEDKAVTASPPPPDDFTTIPGVGLASARSLVAQGVRTFDQLRAADLSRLKLSRGVVNAIEAWRG